MRTALYEKHLELNAKMVDFFGWQMPLQYQGIMLEHLAVRKKVGLFDVSHMGRISVSGKDAETLLDYLSTNKIKDKSNYSATYTVWPNESGGSVDDLIVYREDSTHFFVVVNASNRQKDLEHLRKAAQGYDVLIEDHFENDGILALQGPNALPLIEPLFLEARNLQPMHFISLSYHGRKIFLSGTGYTGSGGFEIYAPNDLIVELWDYFLNEGDPYGLQPIGLGARDTLRLEMGYALYGHELSDTIAPNESVSSWTIKWDKETFIGKEPIEKLEKSTDKRYEYGVILLEGGIAREGYVVFKEDHPIGKVSSGTYAPSLEKAIAIILVNQKLPNNTILDIQIRQHLVKAQVVQLPFFKETNEIYKNA